MLWDLGNFWLKYVQRFRTPEVLEARSLNPWGYRAESLEVLRLEAPDVMKALGLGEFFFYFSGG